MSRFKDWKPPEFDERGWTRYGWRCQHPSGLKLGYGCDIGCFTYINAKYGVDIGKDVQIGSHCLILPGVIIPDGCKIKAMSVVNLNQEAKQMTSSLNESI